MSSKHIRGDYNVAWPSAQLAVMGPEGAVQIITEESLLRAILTRKGEVGRCYVKTFATLSSSSLGYLDDVIQPSETRTVMIKALGALLEKEEVRLGKSWQYSTLGD